MSTAPATQPQSIRSPYALAVCAALVAGGCPARSVTTPTAPLPPAASDAGAPAVEPDETANAAEPPAPTGPFQLWGSVTERAGALLSRVANDPIVAGLGAEPTVVASLLSYEWTTLAAPNVQLEVLVFALPGQALRWSAHAHPVPTSPIATGRVSQVDKVEGLREALAAPLLAIDQQCALPQLTPREIAAMPEDVRIDALRGLVELGATCGLVARAGRAAEARWVPFIRWMGTLVRSDDRFAIVVSPVTIDERGALVLGEAKVTELAYGTRATIIGPDGAAQCTSAPQCFTLGEAAYATEDFSLAAGYFRAACGEGSEVGCLFIADLHSYGRGVARDLAAHVEYVQRAVKLLDTACSGGNGLACASLGHMYADGDRVDRDAGKGRRQFLRAVKIFTKKCNQGDAESCYHLGISRERGQGVARSLPGAVAMYRKACDGGSAGACFNLGGMYLGGRGAPKDAKKAAEAFGAACKGGDNAACRQLALLLDSVSPPRSLPTGAPGSPAPEIPRKLN